MSKMTSCIMSENVQLAEAGLREGVCPVWSGPVQRVTQHGLDWHGLGLVDGYDLSYLPDTVTNTTLIIVKSEISIHVTEKI